MTAGMSFEALNHAGELKNNLIVILNDNRWSISKNVGAMSQYLNRIITGQYYNFAKENLEGLIEQLPTVGSSAVKIASQRGRTSQGNDHSGDLVRRTWIQVFWAGRRSQPTQVDRNL